MSKKHLLTTKAEDLLTLKTNDARAIAKSTMKHKSTDLVSDPARNKPDDSDEKPIDKAAMGGKSVKQEDLDLILQEADIKKGVKFTKKSFVQKMGKEISQSTGMSLDDAISFLVMKRNKDLLDRMITSAKKKGAIFTESTDNLEKMFDTLKSKDYVKVSFGSSIKNTKDRILKVGRKSKSAKHNLEKITLTNPDNPKGVKYSLFKRDRNGKQMVSMAQGDMAVSIQSIEKVPAPAKESSMAKGVAQMKKDDPKLYQKYLKNGKEAIKKAKHFMTQHDDIDDLEDSLFKLGYTDAAINVWMQMIKNKELRESLEELEEGRKKNPAFSTLREQEAFAQFLAAKEMRDPLTGIAKMSNTDIMVMSETSMDFKTLDNTISRHIEQLGLSEDKSFAKKLAEARTVAEEISEDSMDIMIWRAVTPNLGRVDEN